MPSRIRGLTFLPQDAEQFSAEVRRLLEEIADPEPDALEGECFPPVDVYETDELFHITMDLPAVDPGAIRIAAVESAVLVAGEKRPRRRGEEANFHLVERAFGRFARLVRFAAPCDPARAQATLRDGALSIRLPKVPDRRGRPVRIPVEDSR